MLYQRLISLGNSASPRTVARFLSSATRVRRLQIGSVSVACAGWQARWQLGCNGTGAGIQADSEILNRRMSVSTISLTRPAKSSEGFQPKTLRALRESPSRAVASAGRRNL